MISPLKRVKTLTVLAINAITHITVKNDLLYYKVKVKLKLQRLCFLLTNEINRIYLNAINVGGLGMQIEIHLLNENVRSVVFAIRFHFIRRVHF